jgi:hypothetical protein
MAGENWTQYLGSGTMLEDPPSASPTIKPRWYERGERTSYTIVPTLWNMGFAYPYTRACSPWRPTGGPWPCALNRIGEWDFFNPKPGVEPPTWGVLPAPSNHQVEGPLAKYTCMKALSNNFHYPPTLQIWLPFYYISIDNLIHTVMSMTFFHFM